MLQAGPGLASTRATTPSKTNPRPVPTWSAVGRGKFSDPRRHILTSHQLLVLMCIETHIGAHAEGWPTIRRIAVQTQMSERHVARCIDVLVDTGFLVRRRVLPGETLPSGACTRSMRSVYGRGPMLSDAPPSLNAPPSPGQDVRVHPDQESDKVVKEIKKLTTPLTPLEGSSTLEAPREPAPILPPGQPSLPPPPREQQEPKEKTVCEISESVLNEPVQDEDVTEVLTYWHRTLWPLLPGRLERPSRVALVRERLEEGFTVEELCWAVDGAQESSWYSAERHRLSVEVLFKTPERVSELLKAGRIVAETRQRRRAAQLLLVKNADRNSATPVVPISSTQMLADMTRLFEGVA